MRSLTWRIAIFGLLFGFAIDNLCISEAAAANEKAPAAAMPKTDPARLYLLAYYEGVINPVAAEYFSDVLQQAHEANAAVVILKLDTPGGLDTSMRTIIKEIHRSEVPVVVYVAPSGARAASAGVFILMAAHIAAMAPGTNVGAAHPVAMGGGTMDDVMKAKVENDAAAYIRSLAAKRQRNVQWAEDAVRKSVSATEKEALALHVIDLVAENTDVLLAALNGRKVTTVDGPITLMTHGLKAKEVPMGTRLKILNLLSDPNVAYVMMILGIYGLFFELASPGAILPGVVGAIFLILAFYAFQTLPVNYAGVLLILLGMLLFIAEIKITSYGLLSVAGVITIVLGSLMLFNSDIPYLQLSWAVILPTALATAVFFSIAVGLAVRSQRQKPVSGAEGMVGTRGEATTDLNPEGRVFLHGETWNARSDEAVQKGDRIEVVSMEHLVLTVKKVGGSHA